MKARSIGAVVLGLLAVAGVVASVFAIWARSVAFDADKVSAAVDRALDVPAVAETVAEDLTDTVFEVIDIRAAAEALLPARLDRFAETLADGARSRVEQQLVDVLDSERGHAVVAKTVEIGHRQLMNVLDGEHPDGVTVADGEVAVNTLPLVVDGLAVLQGIGLLDEDIELPTLTADGDPTEQIAELSAALDRDLSPDFGQLVVYRDDDLTDSGGRVARAHDALVALKRGYLALLGLTAVALVGTVALARHRWRSVMWLLGGIGIGLVVARLALSKGIAAAAKATATTDDHAMVEDLFADLSSGLARLLWILALVCLAGAGVIWWSGRRDGAAT